MVGCHCSRRTAPVEYRFGPSATNPLSDSINLPVRISYSILIFLQITLCVGASHFLRAVLATERALNVLTAVSSAPPGMRGHWLLANSPKATNSGIRRDTLLRVYCCAVSQSTYCSSGKAIQEPRFASRLIGEREIVRMHESRSTRLPLLCVEKTRRRDRWCMSFACPPRHLTFVRVGGSARNQTGCGARA
jgi:hypothetical protein